MPNVFPTLASGSMVVQSPVSANALAKYPVRLANAYVTRTITFLNDKEQRWTVRNSLFEATLQYSGLNGYDLSLLRSFFYQMMGQYIDAALLNTFSFAIQGVTYNYCTFTHDMFEPTEQRGPTSLTYSLELSIRQVRPN